MISENEKARVKFTKSEETGELIAFVSWVPKVKMLIGVEESSTLRKKICVLSDDLKGLLRPNTIYDVELRPMIRSNGYVVISATRPMYEAEFETIIVPKAVYQVRISFGHKTIFFDPKGGASLNSRTVEGVTKALAARDDLQNPEEVIAKFKIEAAKVLRQMERDGYIVKK